MSDQKAVKPDWKTSIIPSDAGNVTEPSIADTKELEGVIDNPSSLQSPIPIESSDLYSKEKGLDTVPRFNANVAYAPQTITYTANDEILMKAIRIAVKNGWNEYRHYANNAVTIGLEAEAVLTGMKHQRQQVETLLFKKEFCKYLWTNDWEVKMPEMIMSDNQMKYLEENI